VVRFSDLTASASGVRVKRIWVMSALKNMPQVHSTKMRSLRPIVGISKKSQACRSIQAGWSSWLAWDGSFAVTEIGE